MQPNHGHACLLHVAAANAIAGSNAVRNDVPRNASDIFFRRVRTWGEDGETAPPVFLCDGVSYFHVKSGGLLFMLTSRRNLAPALALELLHRVARVVKDYCGVLNEDALRKNFVLVYELLDELLDYGYAQTTSTESLKQFVFNEPAKQAPPPKARAGSLFQAAKRIGGSAINRSVLANERASTARDEIFVDIIERLSVVFNSAGHILTSEVDGVIQMKSYLRGNPEIRIALNEDIVVANRESDGGLGFSASGGVGAVLDDCSFHDCVRLEDFDAGRTIQMVPPDGEFDVMKYRSTSDFRPPFRLFPQVIDREPGAFGIDFALKLRADFPASSSASSVRVTVPLPRTSTRASVELGAQAAGQTWEFEEAKHCLTWTLKKVVGGSEHLLRARVALSQAATSSTRREVGPVSVNFTIPMYNVSKLQVRYLQILNKSKDYKPYRWVRYISQSNSYVCRYVAGCCARRQGEHERAAVHNVSISCD